MAGVVVVGSMWGDEGKGKITDYVVMLEETMQVIPLFMVVRNLL